jgi:hypothetical protein
MLRALTITLSTFIYTHAAQKCQNAMLHERMQGHAIPQAVSRRLPTTVARARSLVRSCGNCGGQSVSVAGFLRALSSPLSIIAPPTAPHSSVILTSDTVRNLPK